MERKWALHAPEHAHVGGLYTEIAVGAVRHVLRHERLAGGGLAAHARGDVDGSAEVVAPAIDRRTAVHPDPLRRHGRIAAYRLLEFGGEADGLAGFAKCQHECV